MRRTPALIVGGGPAGAAAAIGLARAGRPHLLVERTRETGDALCGGFLSWRTLETLAALGVAADDLNCEPVRRVRLFARHGAAEAMLPRPARAVSRRRLDTLLLARAVDAGAAIERGVTVREIDGTHVRSDGGEIAADALFLASGKHDVRGVARPKPNGDPTLGLRVRLAASPALARLVGDAIELHLVDRGYAGLVRQEDGGANLCLAVRRSRLSEVGSPAALLRALGDELPVLGERLTELDARAAIDAVANVPYGWRARTTTPGVWRLGDQAGVIPSLAGEGMGIALASGVAAARAYAAGEAAEAWQRRFAGALRRPLGVAGLVWRLAERPLGADVMARLATPRLIQVVARATRIAHPA